MKPKAKVKAKVKAKAKKPTTAQKVGKVGNALMKAGSNDGSKRKAMHQAALNRRR